MPLQEVPLVPPKLAPWQEDPQGPRDWIKLNTGEWLAGRFLRMENTALHFSSAKFDFIQFDWSDIHVLHLNREARVVLLSGQVLVGHLSLLSASEMLVDIADVSVLIDPSEVVTILVDAPGELSSWTLQTSAGVNLRRGNTTSADFSGDFFLNRRDDFTRFGLQYNGAYGRVGEKTNTNKHLGQTHFDIILSSHSFLIPFFGSLRHDEFQNLNIRYALGAGAGVRPIDRPNFSFDFSVGVGYQQSVYISTQSTDSSRDAGLLVQPQFYFDWDITGDLELAATWYSGVIATQVENTYHHGTLDFSIDLTPRFFLKLGSTFDRQESPRTGQDGVTPRKDDFAVTFSLGLDLQ